MRILKYIYRKYYSPPENSIYLCKLLLKLYNNNHKWLALIIKNKLIKKYGIFLGLNCTLGENILFPHPNGIIIGDGVSIGNDCTIYQQVTLGKRRGDLENNYDYPQIGKNVTIFAGAKIIGNIKVGDNSIIGANSVVINNIEPNSVYVGIPAKKIKKK